MSTQSGGKAEREEVERLLAGGKGKLVFPAAIEARYQRDRAVDRRWHLLVYGTIAVLLFDIFILLDLMLVPDVFETAAVLRFAVVTPLAAAAFGALFLVSSSVFREASQAAVSFIALAAVLYLAVVSRSDLAVYYHFGAIHVIIFANVVQRLDFPYAVGMSLASMAIYAWAVFNIGALPEGVALSAIMLTGCGTLLTLFANQRMEYQLRTAYLYRLRDGLRNDELDALSRVDPLTGLGNRRELDLHLARLWEQPRAEAKPACVLMLDVDHFKKYNDRYGHPAGDLCLKRLAGVIASELRDVEDAAFRFGGEEFVAVLGDSELMDGVRVADRIRLAVEAAGIPHELNGVSKVVTISIGVAASIPAGAITREEVVVAADIALYAAKQAGRNQVWPPLAGKGRPVTWLQDVRSSGGVAS